MSDDPVRAEILGAMEEVTRLVSDITPPGFGDKGHMNYMSNADRSDVCQAMLEFVERNKQ